MPAPKPFWGRKREKEWIKFDSAVAAMDHLKEAGITMKPTQAKRAGLAGRDGWQFSETDPADQNSQAASLAGFVTKGKCSRCDAKLVGLIQKCAQCKGIVHDICAHEQNPREFVCFTCICKVCFQARSLPHQDCGKCKHSVHKACALEGIESGWLCRPCHPTTPKAPKQQAPKPARTFNAKWKIGRPWLQADDKVMWCEACRKYPEENSSETWLVGSDLQNANLCKLDVIRRHGRRPEHCRSEALWQSGGMSNSIVGALPLAQRNGIYSLFRAVYRIVKRGGSHANLEGDCELIALTGGNIIPTHRSRWSAPRILAEINLPIQKVLFRRSFGRCLSKKRCCWKARGCPAIGDAPFSSYLVPLLAAALLFCLFFIYLPRCAATR
jgi:hypothetical protein